MYNAVKPIVLLLTCFNGSVNGLHSNMSGKMIKSEFNLNQLAWLCNFDFANLLFWRFSICSSFNIILW